MTETTTTPAFIPPAKPLIGDEEREAVDRVLRSGMLAQGPEVKAFEEEFSAHFGLGRACVAVNSGTSGPPPRPAVGRGQGRRRGHRPVVHLRGDLQLRRAHRGDAGLRRHQRRRLLPRPGRRRGRDHRAHRRHHAGAPLRPPGPDAGAAGDRRQARPEDLRGRRAGARRLPRRDARRRLRRVRDVLALPDQEHDVRRGRHGVGGRPEVERLMRLYRNQGMEQQYHNEVVGFNTRMTDIHAAIGRVQLTKVDAWTDPPPGQRGLPVGPPRGRHPAAGRRGRRARLPPVHRAGGRATATASAKALREEYNVGSGMFYPVPNHQLKPFQVDVDLPETAQGRGASASRCRSTRRSARRTSSASSTAVNTLAKAGA